MKIKCFSLGVLNLDRVHNNRELMLLQCISGSRAYGLHTPTSDTDIKGVFFMLKREFYGLDYTDQVANETNDIVYYELKKFIDLLLKNNPNILELLNTPADCILYRDDRIMDKIKPELFISKLCKETFAGYAQSQIKKAKGLNKKIFNPVDKERKSVLDFCYVISGYKTMPLVRWLGDNGYSQEECGLVNIPHARDIYALFHLSQFSNSKLNGIASGPYANDVRLSSVEEQVEPLAVMSFNKDGYSKYCKDYKEYWEWVDKRNEERFKATKEQGKNYDAKNMMHTFRLLNMAAEIATEHKINVRRPDREFLLSIRNGQYLYDDLVTMANEKIEEIKGLYDKSSLPDRPDEAAANELLYEIRDSLYSQ